MKTLSQVTPFLSRTAAALLGVLLLGAAGRTPGSQEPQGPDLAVPRETCPPCVSRECEVVTTVIGTE